MELSVRVVEHGDVPVVALDGEVDLATLPTLRDALVRTLSRHPGSLVVVDLDGVAAIDDAGLGVLIGIATRQRATGGDLVFVCAGERLRDVLAKTRVDRAVDVFDTVTAAITTAR